MLYKQILDVIVELFDISSLTLHICSKYRAVSSQTPILISHIQKKLNSNLKYFLHLAYKGTNYSGWQRQTTSIGIQAILEDNLSRMFKQKLTVHGCGRTDAGVHASQYFCHLKLEEVWDFDATFRINKMLPADIKVFDFIPVANTANAQLDVLTRTYDYYIHLHNDPFLSELSTLYLINDLLFEEMKAAVALLPHYTDYLSFCKSPLVYKHTLCTISAAALSLNKSRNRIRFSITSNRFLRAMIRMIVGDLIKIGLGELTLAQFETKLKQPKLAENPNIAYPQGLYLSKVVYPYLEETPIWKFSF